MAPRITEIELSTAQQLPSSGYLRDSVLERSQLESAICRVAAFLILGLSVMPAFAQDPTDLQNRLRAFDGAQLTCKASLLSDKSAANSFLQSDSGTLSEMCECAAMLAVSRKSNSQISKIISSSDINDAVAFTDEVNRTFVECVRMN